MKSVDAKQQQAVQDSLTNSKMKNAQIQKAMIRIFGKFEKLMHLEGRVDSRDTQKRDLLLHAQEQLLKKMNDAVPGGLSLDLHQAQRSLQQAQLQEAEKPRLEGGQNISDEDLRDMLKVLKKQKESMDILQGSVNENTRQLIIMEREIDLK